MRLQRGAEERTDARMARESCEQDNGRLESWLLRGGAARAPAGDAGAAGERTTDLPANWRQLLADRYTDESKEQQYRRVIRIISSMPSSSCARARPSLSLGLALTFSGVG